MRYHNRYCFAGKPQGLRIYVPHIAAVYITVYSPERLESSQFFSNRYRTEIACMPDLIAGFKMPEHGVVKIIMRV